MSLLGGLRFLERHVRPFEIGAGILHVLVEEEPVEFARQIVVALHVALGAAGRVDLLQPAEGVADTLDRLGPDRLDAARPHVLEDNAQKAERIALGNFEVAVHVGFRGGKHRVEGNCALGPRCLDHQVNRVAGAVTERVGPAIGPGHRKVSGADQTCENALQQNIHDNTHSFERLSIVPNSGGFEKFRLA